MKKNIPKGNNPYRQALLLWKKALARENIAETLVKISLMLSATVLILAVGNAVLIWNVLNPPVKYFSTEDGRITEFIPTNEPAWTQNDAADFGSRTLMKALNLDFVHYREQISSVAPGFSEDGHGSYIQALEISNILSTIKNERMNLTASIGAGVVTKRGNLADGTWIWVIQYPVKLRLVGQATARPEQSFTFEVTIQRVDPRKKAAGMEIRQMISRNAPRNQ